MNSENNTDEYEITPLTYQTLNTFLENYSVCKDFTYGIQKATRKGDNYFSVVYRITVHWNNGTQRAFILKVPPKSVRRRERFFSRDIFIREVLAFNEFFTLLVDYQQAKGLDSVETFHEYPKLQFSSTKYFNEAICMDDLQITEFYLHDSLQSLSVDHITILMRIYAKLHATTLVIKHEDPSKLVKFQEMTDIFVKRANDPFLKNYLENLRQYVLDSVCRKKENRYWTRLNQFLQATNGKTVYDLMMEYLEPNSSEPYTTVCHGDCWINNLMFKKSSNGAVIDARLIDWQVMRYASPITDLMYILMACTSKAFRQHYFHKMIDIYYEAAIAHIKRMAVDPDLIFPREGFNLELRSKGAIGVLFGILVTPLLITKSENVPNLEELSEAIAQDKLMTIEIAEMFGGKVCDFKQRMHDIIVDAVDFGFI